MNIQAKVAMDKEKHPERFCPVHRCLWKVVQLDPAPAQTYSPRPDCPHGYCPRHQEQAKAMILGKIEVQQAIQRVNKPTSKQWKDASVEIHRLAELLINKKPQDARG